jgi:hypothetical protein|tara:strand:- start:4 stop:285 length:282 start_codon:yes stop_codon:yes gene_type:complete
MFVSLDNKVFNNDKISLSIFPGFNYKDDNLYEITNNPYNKFDNSEIYIVIKENVYDNDLYNKLLNNVIHNISIKNKKKTNNKKNRTKKIEQKK